MKSLLISVHGKYCTMYANGTKTIEIRKNEPRQDFKRTVFIYNTTTQQIEFKGVLLQILKLKYKTIVSKALGRTGLTEKELFAYAGQKENLVLLDFFNVQRLDKPVNIEQMRKAGITPPQGYLYFENDVLNLN